MIRASIHVVAFACAVVLLASQTAAETRLVAGRSLPQFNAVGRLISGDTEKRSGCSGTLIAPDLVLTAGHCVPRNPDVSARELAKITFAAGWGNDEATAIRQAVVVYRHPEQPPGQVSLRTIFADVALVRLARPVTNVAPMPLGPRPAALSDLIIAGYPNHTNQALTLIDACGHFTPRDRLLFLTCPVIGGNSAGHVLDGPLEAPHVVAVISSRGTGGAYAALIDDWVRSFLD